MDSILLKSLIFFAGHGYHEAERKRGNTFEVDISFDLSLSAAGQSDDLKHTLNYEEAYDIVRSVMQGRPVKLLETLAEKIGAGLYDSFPQVSRITVVIRKLSPLEGPCAYTQISRTWKRS